MTKLRNVALNEKTAEALEARAQSRGVSVSELVDDFLDGHAEILSEGDIWPEWAEKMCAEGRGPWSPEILAEDARRDEEFEQTRIGVPWEEAKAWVQSWGTPGELPPPKPRKL